MVIHPCFSSCWQVSNCYLRSDMNLANDSCQSSFWRVAASRLFMKRIEVNEVFSLRPILPQDFEEQVASNELSIMSLMLGYQKPEMSIFKQLTWSTFVYKKWRLSWTSLSQTYLLCYRGSSYSCVAEAVQISRSNAYMYLWKKQGIWRCFLLYGRNMEICIVAPRYSVMETDT